MLSTMVAAGLRPPSVRGSAQTQRGVFLIEALLGILIFSLGILSLVAMQTSAVSAQSDARYRIEAANLAHKVISTMRLNVDRTSPTASQTSVLAFAHQTTGAPSSCSFSGTASASTLITSWVADVTAAGTGLPGATSAMQQITVTPVVDSLGSPAYSLVNVTLCWKAPIDSTPHRLTVAGMVTY